jgi:hypothetical protein
VLNYAGTTLHTNFVTTCVHAFNGRLKHHVQRWVAGRDIEVWPVCAAIAGWECDREPSPEAGPFVAEERAALGLAVGEKCTDVWRKEHPAAVVRYFYRILRAIPADDKRARRFTLAPVASVKRHFVTLDARVLCSLLHSVKPGLVKSATPGRAWAAAFKGLDKLVRGGAWERDATVQTDGVSLCVRMIQPGGAKATPAKSAPRRKRQRVAAPTDTVAMHATDVVLAVDPGRRTLMHCVARRSDGTDAFYKLSAQAFYHHSGKNRADARRAKWDKRIAQVNAALSAVTPKTASLPALAAYIQVVATNHGTMWNHRLPIQARAACIRCRTRVRCR